MKNVKMGQNQGYEWMIMNIREVIWYIRMIEKEGN